ncbi:MAG TPA: hypothetical protein VFV99_33395, partial [Kofleriaceae bacterium]|nr:hypothetical protein [Kofleriaceae bacterium]
HRKALITRVVEGDGRSNSQQRRAAFAGDFGPTGAAALTEKVVKHAYKVTDEDVAAAKAAGLTEDQIFELVVCSAIGEANRQLETALAALDEATKEVSNAS